MTSFKAAYEEAQQRKCYLRECLDIFPDISLIRTDRRQNLQTIVDGLSRRRADHADEFTNKDMQFIVTHREWNFVKFWPETIIIDPPIKGCFDRRGKLPQEATEAAVRTVYENCRHIEVASIILRFVDPQNYGIISPPTEQLLGLQPSDANVKRYLDYLGGLNEILQQYYKELGGQIANVDMALWSLAHLVRYDWQGPGGKWFFDRMNELDRGNEEKAHRILKCYYSDRVFKEQRLKRALREAYRVVRQDGRRPDRLLLAKCLSDDDVDGELAMVATSYVFEEMVWELICSCGEDKVIQQLSDEEKQKVRLACLIHRLDKHPETEIDASPGSRWRDCIKYRNLSVHPWLRHLSKSALRDFVKDSKKRKEFIDTVMCLSEQPR